VIAGLVRGVRRQLPILAVLAVTVVGFTAVRMWYWRKGMLVMAAALLLAAALRLLLPAGRAGLLVVRSRPLDVAALASLGAALAVLATVIPGQPPLP
jgi:hypothetical protein